MSQLEATEVEEWTESLDSVLRVNGPAATSELLRHLSEHAQSARVPLPSAITTPFRNTISPQDERSCPGIYLWSAAYALLSAGMPWRW